MALQQQNAAIVTDAAGLAAAVSTDNGVDYVYLANDITLSGGIRIFTGKSSLVIDGEYPPGSGTRHQFTDVNSTDYNATFGIGNTSSIAITMRNMVINGRNYYGVPYVIESLWPRDTSGVSVTYENVRYVGPQISYNCNGLVRYVDCDITITQNGAVAPEEVAEASRVEIGGTTTIVHNGASDAVFWFRDANTASSFTVLEGANVTITSANSYFMYNLDGAFGTTLVHVTYDIRPDASLSLVVNKGISFGSSHVVDSFQLAEDASFNYVQTANNGTAATLYMAGPLGVAPQSRFYMEASNGTQPLISFTTGTPRSLTIDDPHSFVLYSPGAAALRSAGTTTFSIDGGQLNAWPTATTPVTDAGGFDDEAPLRWHKLDYASPVQITGSFTASSTTVASHNMVAADEPYPALTNLRLDTARVLSVGDFDITTNVVVNDGRPITGWTQPGANLIVEYELDGATHRIPGTAGPDGRFTISTEGETPPELPVNTVLTIHGNVPFLIKYVRATVVADGDIGIESAPTLIEYRRDPVAFGPPLLPRGLPDIAVVVVDERADESQWQLFASITGPLQSADGDTLTDAVVFLEAPGAAPVTLSFEPKLVYTGGPAVPRTNVIWPEDAGILVRITQPIRSRVRYTTRLIWDLRIVPNP